MLIVAVVMLEVVVMAEDDVLTRWSITDRQRSVKWRAKEKNDTQS